MFSFQEAASCGLCSTLSASCTRRDCIRLLYSLFASYHALSHAHNLDESLPSESALPATDLKGHCHFINIVLVCEKFGEGNFSALNTKYAKMRQRGEGDTLTFDVDRFGEKNKIWFYWSISEQ